MTAPDGSTLDVPYERMVPAAVLDMSYADIVAAAYALDTDAAMSKAQRLFGKVVSVDTAWSDEYQNITVTIQVGELADQPIQCFRLTGEGAKDLKEGDEITVEGILKNYQGTVEFDKGCVLVGFGEIVSQAATLDAAYALEDGAALTKPSVLKGVISSIDSAWSDEYQNITVTIVCDGKDEQPIQCYRLVGEGAKELAVGDEIAVFGTIKNYKGTIEFDKGCVLVPVDSVASVKAVIAGYALAEDAAMTSESTITGVIVARSDFVEAHPAAVGSFLSAYAASVDWVNANNADAAALIGEYGIVDAAVAEKALPYCNIVCLTGADLLEALPGYLEVLYNASPAAVGGEMPDNSFYFA